MPKLVDITGVRFGRITVVERSERKSANHRLWRCRCDCGRETYVQGPMLKTGRTTSCGCAKGRLVSDKVTAHGHARGQGTPEYRSLRSAITRCHNKNAANWNRYGGRGITVCDEWRRDFSLFLAEVGPRPAGTTLDRIDSEGDYAPGNCRWATPKDQANNRKKQR